MENIKKPSILILDFENIEKPSILILDLKAALLLLG